MSFSSPYIAAALANPSSSAQAGLKLVQVGLKLAQACLGLLYEPINEVADSLRGKHLTRHLTNTEKFDIYTATTEDCFRPVYIRSNSVTTTKVLTVVSTNG
jgi:hypothetical protein